MSFGAMILSGWLLLGYMPRGGIEMYQTPRADIAGSFVAELGVDARLGPFLFSSAVNVPMWASSATKSFSPNGAAFSIDFALVLDEMRLGFRHVCAHPVHPWIDAFSPALVPLYESAYEMIYVQIGGKK